MTSVRCFCAFVALVAIAGLAIPVVGAVPATAASESAAFYPLTDEDRVFLEFLKEAVTNDHRDWIADQIHYPIEAAVEGKRITIETKDAFLAHYDEIINERVRRSILTQRSEDLFRNWQGTMIGRGLVWFDGVYQADGCQQGVRPSPDNRVFSCNLDRTWRVMINAINNDFDPGTGAHDGRN